MNNYVRVKDLPGFDMVHDFYWVNDKGDVYSEHLGRHMKKLVKDNGYIQYRLKYSGKRKWKHAHAHRLVALAFLPNPKNHPIVNHIDEDKTNNNVENLEWCTQKHNMNSGTVRERLSESLTGGKLFVYDYKGDEVLRGYGVSESTKKVLGYKDTRVKNKRAGNFFFLDCPANADLLNAISRNSKTKTLLVVDEVNERNVLFPNHKSVEEFLGGTINVTNAIQENWLVKERYRVKLFDFNEKDSPNLCEWTSIRSDG